MSSITWIQPFCSQLRCGPVLASALDEQLAAHARLLSGVDVRSGAFVLVPLHDGVNVEYKELSAGGTSRVLASCEAELVGPDAMAYPARIAWYSEASPAVRIMPEGDWSEDERIRCVWVEFPAEEIRAYGVQPAQPAWVGSTSLAFPVEWRARGWPDVWLELHAQSPFTEEETRSIEATLDSAIAKWNRNNAGRIHYRGPAALMTPRALEIHLDAGSASHDSLSFLLEQLGQAVARGRIGQCVIR